MKNSPPNLDSLSQRFLSELERVVPRDGFHTKFTDRLVVTIPARNAEVGDITVWLDGNEVTLGIGQLHHCHFEVYTQTEPPHLFAAYTIGSVSKSTPSDYP